MPLLAKPLEGTGLIAIAVSRSKRSSCHFATVSRMFRNPGQNAFCEDRAHDARAVANYLLECANERGLPLTNLKIQKLLFFAQAESLVRYRRALVRQQFEAWEMGPVVKAVYDQFKAFKNQPISRPACAFDAEISAWVPVKFDLMGLGAREVVQTTLTTFGRVSAFDLSNLTHLPGSPWDRVRNERLGQANIALQIPNKLILEAFSSAPALKVLN